jgi:outer membrane biosynthesis protein TonB
MERMRFTNKSDVTAGPPRRRLAVALLLSLLIHALLLSLTFGGQGLGLPGFGFPWQERRIEATELHVVVVAPRAAVAEPTLAAVTPPPHRAPVEQTVAARAIVAPAVSAAPVVRGTPDAVVPDAAPAAPAVPEAGGATGAGDASAPARVDEPVGAGPAAIHAPPVIALEQSDAPTRVVPPPAPTASAPVIAAAPTASDPQRAPPTTAVAVDEAPKRERTVEPAKPDPSEQEAQRQAEQAEAARVDAARLEAERRQEAARIEAARQETIRQKAALQEAAREEVARAEAARSEAVRVEAARLEVERQEAARQAAARQEAALREAARQEAARMEAARLVAERQEAARIEAARQEAARAEASRQEAQRQDAARQAAARQEAERAQAAQEDTARREAARRAMGRQLDAEAAAREAASNAARPSNTLPYSWSSARRGRLFGRTDPNTELILYAEAWARKIQQNMTIDMVREAAKRPHADPLVTVAIRNDGSVESVTFVLSSGVAEIDDAIRRIVESQRPYPAFPPGLARDYDVIEIRRTWYFDMAVRLF